MGVVEDTEETDSLPEGPSPVWTVGNTHCQFGVERTVSSHGDRYRSRSDIDVEETTAAVVSHG